MRLPIRSFQRRGHRALVYGCRTTGECYPMIPYRNASLPVAFLFDARMPETFYQFSYRPPAGGRLVTVTGELYWSIAGTGRRGWYSCPKCKTHRGVLYLPPGEAGFACRVCHDLRYATEPMTERARLEYRARHFYRLAGSSSYGLEYTPRPTGMRRRTFAKYMDRAAELDRRAWALAPVPEASEGPPLAPTGAIR